MGEVILITGGSGCLGQHIIKHLQENDEQSQTKEIRVFDLKPYENRLNHSEKIPVKSFTGDITKINNTLKDAFKDVDIVYHCAAFISISFPPKIDKLELVNVEGTRNIVNLCVESNVKTLIYTSDILVTLIPFTKMGMFGAVVNETESKTNMPTTDEQFLIKGYPPSKLRGEKLVLEANGKMLNNGKDCLKTVVLRFPIMYGEEERVCFTKMIEVSEKWNGLPKIAGDGGKHQVIYAGNAAWGHICAKNMLKQDPEKIAGLPVSLTDESPIYDITRFANVMMTRNSEVLKVRPTSWKIPFLLSYLIAVIFEFVVGLLNKMTGYQLEYSPKTIISYCGSLTLWSRMRAAIQMDYDPLYTPADAMRKSAKWYEKWYLEEFKNKKKHN